MKPHGCPLLCPLKPCCLRSCHPEGVKQLQESMGIQPTDPISYATLVSVHCCLPLRSQDFPFNHCPAHLHCSSNTSTAVISTQRRPWCNHDVHLGKIQGCRLITFNSFRVDVPVCLGSPISAALAFNSKSALTLLPFTKGRRPLRSAPQVHSSIKPWTPLESFAQTPQSYNETLFPGCEDRRVSFLNAVLLELV